MNVTRSLLVTGLLSSMVAARADISANSPFLPLPGSAAAAPTESAPIEWRGIMSMGNSVLYLIYDTKSRTSNWVAQGEKGFDFLIKGQGSAPESITVEQSGRPITLTLREAKVASAGQATAPQAMPVTAITPAANQIPAAVTQNVVLTPTPADEAKRLEDFTAEVRRRRLLRDQASQQSVAGQQPVVQPAVTAPPAPAGATQQAQPAATQNGTLRRGTR